MAEAVEVGDNEGRYWLRQAERVVGVLRVLENRESSVEGLVVREGMVRVL